MPLATCSLPSANGHIAGGPSPRFLMCPPAHFGVEYVINPWMNGQIHSTDDQLASRQWSQLHAILSRHAQVVSLAAVKGLPDLVFTANAAVVYRDVAVVSSFRYQERQPEAQHFADWLHADGFDVHFLPPGVLFEGAGDALFDRGLPLLWFGHGFRSGASAQPSLEKLIGVEVQPLELCDSRFYHLDTCFCPLEGGYLVYFPQAFTRSSNQAIEARIPEQRRFAIPLDDALHFTCNAVNIGTKVILNNASPQTLAWLAARGFDVVKTPMTEFMRSGGSAKCLSLRLDEA